MSGFSSKAIVISSLKYGDTSLIVKLYTLEMGIKSFLVRGILKSKKGKLRPAYFQPLTQLLIEANYNPKKTLHSIKEVQVTNVYNSLAFDVAKQSIVIFLSEVLSYSIKEEEANEALYYYLENSFLWLDTHDSTTNFHLLFLLNLTKYLGFYPDLNEKDALSFDLIEGRFTVRAHHKENISGNELLSFKKLLGINFDEIESVSFNRKERQMILQIIIRYFELHLDGFRKPKSLEVLQDVFEHYI